MSIESTQEAIYIRSLIPGISIWWIEQNYQRASLRFNEMCKRLNDDGEHYLHRPLSFRILFANDTVVRFSHVESGDMLRGEMVHEAFVYSDYKLDSDFHRNVLSPALFAHGGKLHLISDQMAEGPAEGPQEKE